jgi:hypothetical protein
MKEQITEKDFFIAANKIVGPSSSTVIANEIYNLYQVNPNKVNWESIYKIVNQHWGPNISSEIARLIESKIEQNH